MYTECVKQNSPKDYIMHPHHSQHNLTYTLTIPTTSHQDSYATKNDDANTNTNN